MHLLACYQSQNIQTVVQLVQKAIQNPPQALSICQQIHQQSYQEECLLNAALQMKGKNAMRIAICEELTGSLKGECFFIIAEETKDVAYCTQATPFEDYCKQHLFQHQTNINSRRDKKQSVYH